MAYETELANFITIGNAVSAYLGPAFVAKAQGMPFVFKEVFPDNTNVIKFRKAGYLVAETVAESTDYTYSANSKLTDSMVSCTAEKHVAGHKMTVEAQRFGGSSASLQRAANEMAAAHARLFDTKLKALFSSISGGVTATSTLVKDNLIDARYTVVSTMKDGFSGKLVGFFDYKGVSELQKELTNITATAFSNMNMLGVLGMPRQADGYAGNVLGIDIYQTDGLPTSSSDDVACVWDPMHCFGAGVDGQNGFYTSVKEPAAINGISTELLSWTFYKIVEVNDGAGVRVLSDT